MTQPLCIPLTGPTYFFTLRLADPASTTLTDHIESLRFAYAKAVAEFPVTCHAMVVLPNHLHAVWTERPGEIWHAERWRRIKTRFAQALPRVEGQPVWQRRFSEYPILTEDDLSRAIHHCDENPVRHGLVAEAGHWPYSSFAKSRKGAGIPGSVPDASIPPRQWRVTHSAA